MEIPYVVTPRKDTGLFNSKVAIWLFLASEVMLFGGFFSAYVFLRLGADYPWPERTLPVLPGLINTFILIASSVTVVFAWAALKMRQWARFQLFMGITVACAAIFMVFKGIEYNVKFHHAAARLTDYTVIEGHLDYEKKGGGHGDHGGDHGGEGEGQAKKADYLLDPDGDKIQFNHHRFATESLTFDLLRAYDPWIRDWLEQAESAGVEITLAEDIDFNAPGEDEGDKRFSAGAPLSVDLLDELYDHQASNKARNAEWRTRFLREALAEVWAEVEREDLLGEGAFAAEYPKALELSGKKRDKAYDRWRSIKRAKLSAGADLTGARLEIDGEMKRYADVELPEKPTATFEFSEPLLLRFPSHDVITEYEAGGTSLTLRDGTVANGEYQESPMVFHYVDAIDFRHLVQIAEEKGQDPEKAIENSWLLKNHPEFVEIWEKHRKAVGQLEEELAEEGREPTDKDRYRIGWPTMVYYVDTPLDEVQVPGKASLPKIDFTIQEQFMGPDYDIRHFPHLSVPREKVMLDSKFTPKWNTYYAIYFTITGLHGLHVVGGAIVLAYYLFFGKKMYLTNPEWLANRVEVGGLFWHFVDLIWIFAFPIFYLM